MSETKYAFPVLYDFPPLFTIQQNETTRTKQLDLWMDIVLGYCKHYNVFRFDVSKIDATIDPRTEGIPIRSVEQVFSNPRIKRKLTQVEASKVIEHLVSKNTALYDDSSTQTQEVSGIILWKSIERWGDEIYSWAQDTGRKNTLCTFHELIHGDSTVGLGFHGLDEELALKVVTNLSQRNKVGLLHGKSRLEIGLKFS